MAEQGKTVDEQTSKPTEELPKDADESRIGAEDTTQIENENGLNSEPAGDEPETGDVLVLPREKNGFAAALKQQPSLYGRDDVEVAERTQDTTSKTATEFTKHFVVSRAQYEAEDPDAVHSRNETAVRQFMVNQGLRPDADVRFVGEEDYWDDSSVVLVYSVGAVPAAVARSFGLAHTVISADGPTPEQRAAYEARKEARVVESRDVLRGV